MKSGQVTKVRTSGEYVYWLYEPCIPKPPQLMRRRADGTDDVLVLTEGSTNTFAVGSSHVYVKAPVGYGMARVAK